MFKDISVPDLYASDQTHRYQNIIKHFQQKYGTHPDFIARAPGRVNLIGEHIDYQGYGVLPFAIQKDCVIAVSKTQTKDIHIKHINSHKYPDHIISYNVKQVPKYQNVYVRYFYAGYEAALKEAATIEGLPKQIQQKVAKGEFQGMNILIEGNVPKGSGLSSSSSLCVCSALATLRANNLNQYISKQQFIFKVIKYQRMVGTAIGGMDQSISVLGQSNSALYIQFNPIKSTVVQLPKNYKFVITNSLEQSNKIQTLGKRYNKRVCECFLGVRLLARNLKITKQQTQKMSTFKDLQQYCKLPIHEMLLIVQKFLDAKEFTKTQLQSIFGPLEQFLKEIPNSNQVLKIDQTYSLYNAAIHVYSESQRVLTFINVCNSCIDDHLKGILLGELMNRSQQSCRDRYKCSSQLLDVLTSLAIKQGAVGSRLTGAGWGGCAVSLVEESKVTNFIDKIKQNYYSQPQFSEYVKSQGIQNLIFQTSPTEGACFIDLK